MRNFYEKCRHLYPFAAYLLVYLAWFAWLEDRFVWRYEIIHTELDDRIPFCEVFIVPYLLWFVYVAAVVLFQAAYDRESYYRNAVFLCIGMTVFLLVSTFWPNGQHLRPYVMPRDNIFTRLVAALYRTDTPTNIWPSIHVYNSIASHIGVCRTFDGGDKKHRILNRVVRFLSLILCVSIVLSTMFLKQHSTFDVFTALLMAGIVYIIVYRCDLISHMRQSRQNYQRKHADRRPFSRRGQRMPR